MASRWDSEPDDFPSPQAASRGTSALPPRWSDAARALLDNATTDRVNRSPGQTARRALSRDFRSGARADGLPAEVTRGLRWLDAEVRERAPSAGALLLAQSFQESFAALLSVDRIFLPEETLSFTAGATLAGILALPGRAPEAGVALAGTMAPSRRAVLAAWCRRLGTSLAILPEPDVAAAGATPFAAIVVETPNAAGLLENLPAWRAVAGPDAPVVVLSADPLAFFADELPVGTFADIAIFDAAALAAGGDEAAAIAVSSRWAPAVRGLYVEASRLLRSDGAPIDDEPSWGPVFAGALLAAELGIVGFRRRARAVRQRRRWIESVLERRGLSPTTPPGRRFREAHFEIPRWRERHGVALAEGFRLEECADGLPGSALVRCALGAQRSDTQRLAEVLAGG